MNLKSKYTTDIHPQLLEATSEQNIFALPKMHKITVTVGIGKVRDKKEIIEKSIKNLSEITGQKPIITKTKKAIAGFKVRENEQVGLKVTLRNEKMYDFYDRLINTALPQIRNFQGIKFSALDKQGNVSIGIKEHVIFPEMSFDEVDTAHGMGVTLSIKAKDKEQAIAYLKVINFPFERK